MPYDIVYVKIHLGKEEEHQVEIETKEVTSFQDFFKRQTSMLSPPSDHETEDDCADCNPLEKVNTLTTACMVID